MGPQVVLNRGAVDSPAYHSLLHCSYGILVLGMIQRPVVVMFCVGSAGYYDGTWYDTIPVSGVMGFSFYLRGACFN